jgi:hypothetical protein
MRTLTVKKRRMSKDALHFCFPYVANSPYVVAAIGKLFLVVIAVS